jgi:hypothetical protein
MGLHTSCSPTTTVVNKRDITRGKRQVWGCPTF